MLLFRLSPLIVPSDNTSTTIPNRLPETLHSDERVKQNPAMDENKLDGGSTSSATAKLLRGVRDSANAFIPLKSIAGGLCFILENCEV